MYSFKGGAGRTVSTANIAYVLAKEKQKRVLVIDLDVESAGASVLFEVEDAVERGDRWTIQDVFLGYFAPRPAKEGRNRQSDPARPVPAPETGRESINLDLGEFASAVWPRLHFDIWPTPEDPAPAGSSAYLKFLPARRMLYSPDEQTTERSSEKTFQYLLKRIDALAGAPEIILFDSASGLQNTAMMGFQTANVLMMFARWSRQFINGTIQFVDDYVVSPIGRQLDSVFFVPTAVPAAPPTGKLLQELQTRRKRLDDSLWISNRDAASAYGKPEHWIREIGAISEADGLKWDDKILLREGGEYIHEGHLEKVLADYRHIADQISTMARTKRSDQQKRGRLGERPRV